MTGTARGRPRARPRRRSERPPGSRSSPLRAISSYCARQLRTGEDRDLGVARQEARRCPHVAPQAAALYERPNLARGENHRPARTRAGSLAGHADRLRCTRVLPFHRRGDCPHRGSGGAAARGSGRGHRRHECELQAGVRAAPRSGGSAPAAGLGEARLRRGAGRRRLGRLPLLHARVQRPGRPGSARGVPRSRPGHHRVLRLPGRGVRDRSGP